MRKRIYEVEFSYSIRQSVSACTRREALFKARRRWPEYGEPVSLRFVCFA